ncbi:MAG: sulfatase-like hydrolase/transferase, partial [Leptospira sp.]|nr:sulfatase-like hydrolase/transferase [Leptospira sp.]
FFRNNGYYTGAAMNNVFFLDYTGVGIDLGFHEIIQIGRDIEDTERITDEAIAFIKRNREKAFFLHINWNTPHGSYVPPTSVMRKLREENKANNFQALHPNAQRYLGEIRFTDDEIGKFIDALKKEKLYDESVIIITSDHGEVLNDYHDSANNPNGGTIFGHGESLFDEELNVPFLIKYPVSIRQKIKNNLVAGQSSLLSFLPTLAGLVGFPDQEKGWKGKDYSQYIFGKTGEIKEDVIYSEGRLSESIRTENFKYIRKYPGFVPANNSAESKFSGKREELYDLDCICERILNSEPFEEGILF